jgi:hypothetical protein
MIGILFLRESFWNGVIRGNVKIQRVLQSDIMWYAPEENLEVIEILKDKRSNR